MVNCTITSKFNQMIVMLSHYLLNYRLGFNICLRFTLNTIILTIVNNVIETLHCVIDIFSPNLTLTHTINN